MTDPEAALDAIIRRWEQLTAQETDAIAADAWDLLAEVQDRKAQVQADWTRIGSSAGSGWRSAASRLIEKERCNAETLSRRLAGLREQLAQLDRSERFLRRVQSSYAPAGSQPGAFNGMA